MTRRILPSVNKIWLLAAGIVAVAVVVASTTIGVLSSGSTDNSLANASANTEAGPAKVAHKSATKPYWSELTAAQKTALAPLAAEWDQIPVARKKKWLEIGHKVALMSPEEQLRVQERIRDWVKLTPEQRRTARTAFVQAQKLSPNEKFAQWQQYQQLTEDQKKELAALETPNRKHVANPPAPSSRPTKLAKSVKSAPRPVLEKSVLPPAPQPAPAVPVTPAPVVPAPAETILPVIPETNPV